MPAYLRHVGTTDVHALHLAHPERFPFLLESRLKGGKTGRFSLLLGDVREQTQCHDPQQLPAWLESIAHAGKAAADMPTDLPFCGGWFVYLAYEAASGLLPHLGTMPKSVAPLARAAYCASAVVVDHQADCSWFVGDAEALASMAQNTVSAESFAPALASLAFQPEAEDAYCAQVRQAIDYILAGDIYQANLARRWQAGTCSRDAVLAAYTQLRRHNPACFSASVLWDDFALASASPERLFRLDSGVIDTRPIAGTRATSADPVQDRKLQQELLGHPKEQAEHIMLVDLERHDLGRISQPGSVKVDELLALESYASVHHLVSNVRGQLADGVSLPQLLAAIFPGGTITGCPKIRCMQIIAELEARPRGAYTGSLGYISDCGRMDFNILIRTLVWQDGCLHLDAGAGIVADSQPQSELQETAAKAQGVLQALAAAAGDST